MTFAKPPGDLAWLSVLWLIGALAGMVLGVKMGMIGFAVLSGALLLATIGLWFQSDFARRFLIGWFCVAIVLGCILLFVRGVSLRGVIQLAGAAYSLYELVQVGRE